MEVSRRVRHSGEHLLVGALTKLVPGSRVVRVVHEEKVDKAFIESEKPITWSDVLKAARKANEAIASNIPFKVEFFESLEEARRIHPDLRAYEERLQDKDFIRVVIIEGYDKSACINEHVSRAGEVGLVLPRLLRSVRSGLYELEFYTGWNAVEYALVLSNAVYKGARILGSSIDDFLPTLETCRNRLESLENSLDDVTVNALYNWPVEDLGSRLLYIELPHLNMKRVMSRAAKVMSDRDVDLLTVVSWDGEKHLVFIASREISLDSLKQRIVEVAGGRGGGGPKMYSGYVEYPEKLRRLVYDFVGGMA